MMMVEIVIFDYLAILSKLQIIDIISYEYYFNLPLLEWICFQRITPLLLQEILNIFDDLILYNRFNLFISTIVRKDDILEVHL